MKKRDSNSKEGTPRKIFSFRLTGTAWFIAAIFDVQICVLKEFRGKCVRKKPASPDGSLDLSVKNLVEYRNLFKMFTKLE